MLTGGGALGDLIRAHDWASAGIGPFEAWPASLRSIVQTILFSAMPMVVVWGRDGIIIYNEHYARILGPRHPHSLGGKLLDVWPEARDFNAKVIEAGLAGKSLSFHAQELELLRHGGAERVWMDLEYTPVLDENGVPGGTLAIVLDITQRVLGDRRLAESEARLRFLDELGQSVADLNDADQILAVTTRMVGEHLGLSNCAYADMDADEDGFTIRGNWHEPDSPSIVGHYSLADFGQLAVQELGAGRPLIINDNLAEIAPHEAKTFQDIGIAATICMPLVKHGRLLALMAIHHKVPHHWTERELGLIREVTERSWAHIQRVGAEANLRAREEQLRLATEAAEVGLWDVDEINGTLFWPPRVKAMFGISAHVDVTMADYFGGLHPEDYDATAAAYLAATDPERQAHYDVEYRTVGKEDGVVRWVAAKGRGIFQDGRCVRVLGTALDITKRKAIERQLRDLNETLERRVADALAERKLLADIVEGTDAFVQVADRDFRWLAINRAAATEFETIYGVRPQVGKSMLEALQHQPEHREAVCAIWSRALAGEEFTELGEFGDDGRSRRCYEMKFNALRNTAGELIGAYQFVYDVTDRVAEQRRLVETQDQLRQAQKMDAMGQLTGGVAHDFNNLLTPIIGSLDLLQSKGYGTEREQRMIEGALQSAERAKTLVQRLLAFARRQPLQPTAIDVAELISGMAGLIDSTSGPQVRMVTELEDDLPPARGDLNQLEMGLLNLCVNARDAMPNGGTLRVSAVRARADHEIAPELKPGDYIRVSVADTGTGMDEATLSRAVDPFFSTKGIGKGTGLGLSMVHGLAQQLGGALRIHSRLGVGTNVELWLPVTERAGLSHRPEALTDTGTKGQGKVLLVDDEDLVRACTANMLIELGFEVEEARSAEDALRLLRAGAQPKFLITDHLMPGMDGTELARAAQTIAPTTVSLIVSGYAEVEGIAADLPRLAKPFRIAELAAKIRELSGHQAGGENGRNRI